MRRITSAVLITCIAVMLIDFFVVDLLEGPLRVVFHSVILLNMGAIFLLNEEKEDNVFAYISFFLSGIILLDLFW